MIINMFSINKSAQIICFLLRKSGGDMNVLKLMNLLYLCDRESMNIYDEPITNDEWFSTSGGFILSKTNDLINSDNKWFYISSKNCLALKHITDEYKKILEINKNSYIDVHGDKCKQPLEDNYTYNRFKRIMGIDNR